METSHPLPSCTAILVAAGSSRRMGMDKLLWPLAGVAVLQRTIHAFLNAKSISSIIVVCPPERWSALDTGDFTKPVSRADGGTERHESVAKGLELAGNTSQFVAVHDAARPLVSPADIDRCVIAAANHRAAALARRATETMMRSDADAFSAEPVNRENLWCMETPQVFETELLRQAYAAVRSRNLTVTDEVSAMREIDVKTKFVESGHPNLKITTPADLALAEALLQQAPSP